MPGDFLSKVDSLAVGENWGIFGTPAVGERHISDDVRHLSGRASQCPPSQNHHKNNERTRRQHQAEQLSGTSVWRVFQFDGRGDKADSATPLRCNKPRVARGVLQDPSNRGDRLLNVLWIINPGGLSRPNAPVDLVTVQVPRLILLDKFCEIV